MATFAFKSPENLRLLLIAYPSSVGGIHLKQLSDFPGPPHTATEFSAHSFRRFPLESIYRYSVESNVCSRDRQVLLALSGL